jgi:mono/diheme cytochrome c family protein
MIKLTTITLTTLLAVAAYAEDAKLPPASEKADITYATDIKPIFDVSCVKCHSGDQAKARFKLDTLEGALKGANRQGKFIVAGDPDKSLLLKSIAHLTKDPQGWMPPPQNRAGIKPLTSEQIGLVIGWVKQGAK